MVTSVAGSCIGGIRGCRPDNEINAQNHQADLRHDLRQDSTRRDGVAGKMIFIKKSIPLQSVVANNPVLIQKGDLIHKTKGGFIRQKIENMLIHHIIYVGLSRRRSVYRQCSPPSTGMMEPLIQDASSVHSR